MNEFDSLQYWIRAVANKTPALNPELSRLKVLLERPYFRKLKAKMGDFTDKEVILVNLEYCKKYGKFLEQNDAQSVQVSTEIYSCDGMIIEFDSGIDGYFHMTTYDEKGYFGK